MCTCSTRMPPCCAACLHDCPCSSTNRHTLRTYKLPWTGNMRWTCCGHQDYILIQHTSGWISHWDTDMPRAPCEQHLRMYTSAPPHARRCQIGWFHHCSMHPRCCGYRWVKIAVRPVPGNLEAKTMCARQRLSQNSQGHAPVPLQAACNLLKVATASCHDRCVQFLHMELKHRSEQPPCQASVQVTSYFGASHERDGANISPQHTQ
jgi:hypothetical protein